MRTRQTGTRCLHPRCSGQAAFAGRHSSSPGELRPAPYAMPFDRASGRSLRLQLSIFVDGRGPKVFRPPFYSRPAPALTSSRISFGRVGGDHENHSSLQKLRAACPAGADVKDASAVLQLEWLRVEPRRSY